MMFHDIAPKGKTDGSVSVRGHWIQAMSSLFNRKPNKTCEPLRKANVESRDSHDVKSQGSTEYGNEEETFFDLDEDALSQLPPHLQNNMRELHLQRTMRLATQNQYKTTKRSVNLVPGDDSPWSMPIPAFDGYHNVQESHAASSAHWYNSRFNVVPLETIVGLQKIHSTPQGPEQHFTAENATLCELETSQVDISEYEQFGVPLCRSSEMKNVSFGKKPSLASNIRIRVKRSIHRLNKLFKKLNNSEICTWKRRREICTR
jgi:hypothetical protein